MDLKTLEAMTDRLRLAYEADDLQELQSFLSDNSQRINQLAFGQDEAYNQQLELFIRLYLEIQRSLQDERKEVSSVLKKLKGTKKGLQEYNKASNGDRP